MADRSPTPCPELVARNAMYLRIRLKETLGLLLAILLCYGAAALGALATRPGLASWYTTLRKPWWNPPDWVFGPVWSILYAMMAVAAWDVWRRAGFEAARGKLGLFALQLGLNVAWSCLFFMLRLPGLAFCEIVLLWWAILMTILAFRGTSRLAAGLMVPYWLWVTFATLLNFFIWWLNLPGSP